MRVSHKIVVRLLVLVACSALWPSMPMMMALEVHQIPPEPLYDCLISVYRETGDDLQLDYAMNPYYLRLDLNGDRAMDYITILVDESGKVRRGLLVCSSEGKATIYQGVEDSEKQLDPGKCPSVDGVVADLVLTEERSSQTRPPEPYLIMKCCEPDGEITSGREKSSQTIPIGFHWRAITQSEIRQNLKGYGGLIASVEPAGEGVVTGWREDVAIGFSDGKRFRWVLLSIADCPE